MANSRPGNQLTILFVIILLVGSFAQIVKQPTAAEGQFRISVLDIGQGDAILLDTPHGQHILVDSGPLADTVGVLGRYLTSPHEFRLVIASHNHSDHIGGFPAILREYATQEVWMSGSISTTAVYTKWLQAVKDSQAKVRLVSTGMQEVIDGLTIDVVHPMSTMEGIRLEQEHDSTVAVKVSYGAVSILLTGDMAENHEADMLSKDRAILGATILKVAHHGSKYGTSDTFLEAVHPQVAVISVGAGNKFGHPHQETLDRLAKSAVPVYRTDQNGTVQFTTDGARLWVRPERGKKVEVDIVGGQR